MFVCIPVAGSKKAAKVNIHFCSFLLFIKIRNRDSFFLLSDRIKCYPLNSSPISFKER